MNKNLLLSLTLILSANTWADDEFPIELTCEFGIWIVYFHLDSDKENSWLEAHESTEFNTPKKILLVFEDERYKGKYSKWESYEVRENIIEGRVANWALSNTFKINRTSLGIEIFGNIQPISGQCYKGFKEYEKQI